MTKAKPIDEALFAKMWQAGEQPKAIALAVGLHQSCIAKRAAKMGIARPEPEGTLSARAKLNKYLSKPKADPAPEPEPVYRPGLSDAIKRARSSDNPVARLGKVATMYGMKYRDVLEMAGVQP